MTLRRELEQAIFDGALTDQEPPYREHSWLVKRALTHPPITPRATATSFSGWVFDLSHVRRNDRQQALERGRSTEQRILERRKLARSTCRDYPSSNDLEIIFEDPLDGSAIPLQASALTVGGQPLQCIPDRVLKNTKTQEIFVFEHKTTPFNVPAQGWPNLKVQLWCYGWIDHWLNAPEVYLIGVIWTPKDGQWVRSQIVPRWRRSDRDFCAECTELFGLFGGVASTPSRPQRGGAR